MKKDYIVVSFSGGKDSTAMLLRLIELGEHIDEVIFIDTYKEFPQMYRHIEKVRGIVEKEKIKFTELKSKYTFDYLMFDFLPKRNSSNKVQIKGKGWANARMRWCTGELKTGIVNRYLSTLSKKYNIIQLVGIAADELYRLNRKNNLQLNKRHPLVEWGWKEKDCLEYCYRKGYDWEGIYSIYKRVSCWCCPLQTLDHLRSLRKYFPELWQELREMDKKAWNQFRADYSVEDLEKRFDFEEMRQAKGLSITNREFYRELKEYLGTPENGQISMFNTIDAP